MAIVITVLISALLVAALPFLDNIMQNIIPTALYAERYMTVASGADWFGEIQAIFFGFGISVIVLKFLKKGFDVYVGWTDGDADADPLGLLTRFVRALAVAVCFPTLYALLADTVTELGDQLMTALSSTTEISLAAQIAGIATGGIFLALVSLIFYILVFVLYLQFLVRGLEMLILRIGVPFACVGLVDSDKGVFGPYIKKFFQSALAVIVQLSLCKLGLGMMMNSHIFWAVACMMLAMRAPRFLSEFILMSGGGGGGIINKIYYTSNLIRSVSQIVKK